MTATIDTRNTSVFDYIIDNGYVLEDDADEAERIGRLTDRTAQMLRESGIMRMMQPLDFGGLQTHPVDYMKALVEIGRRDASAGWVCGVVGVHPHELAHGYREMQEEVWGENPDTWVASPYAPMGRAVPTDGGYLFNGRWPYSTGTDHCDWVMIGGLVVDTDGNQLDPNAVHFVLPRSDYEIVEGSWEVMGLKGTGSKDLIVRDAFVPTYRTISTVGITEGTGGHDPSREDQTLYRIPRNALFSAVITGGTLAASRGALDAYVNWTMNRREGRGGKASLDPYQLSALGAAAADIDASILHVLHDMERVYDICERRELVSLDVRTEIRRNQVAASHRAVNAVNEVFKLAGGGAIYEEHPLQRRWRDAQAALHHIQNQAGPLYQAYGLNLFGHAIPGWVKV